MQAAHQHALPGTALSIVLPMKGHAEIAGAGFAGLAAAIALARSGWTVRVHERDDALRSHGAGIYVHPFAQSVLRDLGAFDRVAATAFTPTARYIHIDGQQRSVTETDGHVLTTTRAHLHAAVAATAREAGVVIATRSAVVGADPAGILRMEGGAGLEADLVIAADGVRAALAEQAGIPLRRRRHEDGITRVNLLDRAGLEGPEWDAIHDFYDYRVRPLRILYTPCGPDIFYFCLTAPAHDDEAAAVPIAAASLGPQLPPARADHRPHRRPWPPRPLHDNHDAELVAGAHRRPRRRSPCHALGARPGRRRQHAERPPPRPRPRVCFQRGRRARRLGSTIPADRGALAAGGRSGRQQPQPDERSPSRRGFRDRTQHRSTRRSDARAARMSLVPTDPWYQAILAAVGRQQAGITDYVGRPWAQHFERVALRVMFRNPQASRSQIEAALLHDAFMDRGGSQPMLEALHIGPAAIEIIELTTPPPNADYYRDFQQIGPAECALYLDYIGGLVASGHRPAIEMKLADIQDTIDACRLGATDLLTGQYINRYEPSRRLLEAALSNLV